MASVLPENGDQDERKSQPTSSGTDRSAFKASLTTAADALRARLKKRLTSDVNSSDRRLLHGAVLKTEDALAKEEDDEQKELKGQGFSKKHFLRSTPNSREALLRSKSNATNRGRIVFDLDLKGIRDELWNALSLTAPLKPYGRIRSKWDAIILLFICYGLFMIPFDLAFAVNPIPWLLLDVILDLFFMADLCLNFVTSYVDEGNHLVTDFHKIRWHYLTTWFTFDLIASMPFGIISLLANDGSEALNIIKLLKMFRVLRMSHLYRAVASLSAMKGPVLVLALMVGFGICAHWIACLFWKIGTVEIGHNWIIDQTALPDLVHRNQLDQYMACLYWAMATLTTTGYGDFTPVTHAEYVYVTVVVIIGAAMYAILISSVSMIVMSQFSAEAEYTRHMDAVQAFGRLHHLPPEVNQRVVAYYDFLWERKKTFSNTSLITDLPLELKAIVAGAVHGKMIEHNPLLASCDSFGFKHMFAAKVGSIVLRLPDEVLHFEGDCVSELFFVRRGLVDIVVGLDTPDELVVGKRSDGGHCGDIGLFVSSQRHATSAVTVHFSEVCSMDAYVLLELLKQYPREREMFERVAKARVESIERLLTELDQVAADKQMNTSTTSLAPSNDAASLVAPVLAVGENAGRFLLKMFGQNTTDSDAEFFWKMWEQQVTPESDAALVEDTLRAYSIEAEVAPEDASETHTLKPSPSFHLGRKGNCDASEASFMRATMRRRSSMRVMEAASEAAVVEDMRRRSATGSFFLDLSLEERPTGFKRNLEETGMLAGVVDTKQHSLMDPSRRRSSLASDRINEDGFETVFLKTLSDIDSRMAQLERRNDEEGEDDEVDLVTFK